MVRRFPYYVCQLARDEVVVVLSGGGDEALPADTYRRSRCRAGSTHSSQHPPGTHPPVANWLPVSDKLSFEFRLKRFLGGQDLSFAQAHLWWRQS
jgi:hypothetical protein